MRGHVETTSCKPGCPGPRWCHLSAAPLKALCVLLLGLLHGLVNAAVVEVDSPEALKQALAEEVEHIVVKKHLDFTGVQPQLVGSSDEHPFALSVSAATLSVTGRCTTAPTGALATEWKSGQCLIRFTDTSGFSLTPRLNDGAKWFDSLYLVMAGGLEDRDNRYAIHSRATSSATAGIYMTDITLESQSSTVQRDFAMWMRGPRILASGLQVLNFGPSSVEPVYLSNGPHHIFDSTFSGNTVDMDICSKYTCYGALMTVYADVKLERCAYIDNMAGTPYLFRVQTYGSYANIYSDDVVLFDVYGVETESWPISNAADLDFLTLQDPAFLRLKSQVEGGDAGSPPAVIDDGVTPTGGDGVTPIDRDGVTPANGDDATPVDGGPDVLPPVDGGGSGSGGTSSSGGSSAGPIAGGVAGVLVVVAVGFCGFFVWRRKKRAPAQDTLTSDSGGSKRMAGHDSPKAHQFEVVPADASGALAVTMNKPRTDSATTTTTTTTRTSSMRAGRTTHQSAAQLHVNTQSTTSSGPDFVTMTQFGDDSADCTIRVVERTRTAAAAVSRPPRRPLVHADTHESTIEALEDALEDMYERSQLLMGRWEVLSAVHRRVGGQGIVQYIKDRITGEELVVKLFLDGVAFQREAELYGQPHFREMMAAVVCVHDNADGSVTAPDGFVLPPFIVLEKGRSLDEWAVITEPDFATSLQVLIQIVKRLIQLHACGTVHRDLKPANVLWRIHKGQWTLIDFGCAAAHGSEARLACSIPYAPPEVALAVKENRATIQVDASMDIWSLGVIIFELLTGRRAYPGLAVDGIVDALTGGEPLPWESGSADAHLVKKLGVLKHVVKLCLSRDASKRPTAEALLGTLNHMFCSASTLAQTQSSVSA